ncbi:unnamed protein product [Wuchereria bancrofti]|uniref:Uncharacterized protein n=1 Tax=Wuchereria bancrofti TaxID=6293 RepID=A0A3P7ED52_WUCBA|nr:unnamed protein product [Wuchereria bancrofti]
MKIIPFGMKKPGLHPAARTQLNVQTEENKINTVFDYLTNELQVLETPKGVQFQGLTNHWRKKKPDVPTGADYFVKFIIIYYEIIMDQLQSSITEKVHPKDEVGVITTKLSRILISRNSKQKLYKSRK